MQETNPYESPSITSQSSSARSRIIWIFCFATVATIILSLVNALQETSFPLSAVLISVFVPMCVQVFGLTLAVVRTKFPNRYTNVLLVPAFLIAILSVSVLSAWVVAGEFREPDDAVQFRNYLFQIHPIAIPFSLVVISAALYGIAVVFAAIMLICRNVFFRAPS